MVFGEFQLKADDEQSACEEMCERADWHSARSRYGLVVEDIIQLAPGEIVPSLIAWPESERVDQVANTRRKAQTAWPAEVGSRSEYEQWDNEQLDGLVRCMIGPTHSLASLLGTQALQGADRANLGARMTSRR